MSVCNESDTDDDHELARAKEESLRYYEEMEIHRKSSGEPNAHVSNKTEILNTQVGGKVGSILYNGNEAEGFHIAAGNSYIYPTNYPLRQYQATIVKTALFKNTLVSLPTGLGKTFIAAVVMYNFYRWYPCGKIVFMAPTRPLVAQQIRACHDIMNIPVADTVEMTGNLNAQQRMTLWKEKRVFFLTPQVMVNDLRSNACPSSLIKCLVVDEAHRAVKDYAYCQVVRQLLDVGVIFRILALSATPGNDSNAVQQVIRNLNIAALELRGEDALDVAPYTHSRSVENIVVDLSVNIQRVKQDFLQVYEKYARKLKDIKALNNNISTISKFQIMKACEKFRSNPPRDLPASLKGSLICNFTVCMSLAHALDLLQTYGLRAFFNYLADENCDSKNKAASTRIRNDDDLKKILDRLGQILSSRPGSGNYIWGHPKYQKLLSIVSDHFSKYETTGESTRAIIFCEYRIVVNEIVDILESAGQHVKPVMFIGQSGGKDKGMPQAKQLQIMKEFRSGEVNCLVSTCVGEEGLDVGDVDLIILVETHKSLTRLVQRIGRTGRKRKGRCVVLLTRGREEYKFQEAMTSRKSYVTNILSSAAIKSSLYQDSPRMMPPNVNPERELVHIKPDIIVTPAKTLPKKQIDIRECMVADESPFINSEQYNEVINELGEAKLLFNKLPSSSSYLWHRSKDNSMTIEELLMKDVNVLSDWIDWNREEHMTFEVGHTPETSLLCHLLDKRRNKPNFIHEQGFGDAVNYINSLENDLGNVLPSEKRKHLTRSVSSESSDSEEELSVLVKQKGKIKRVKQEVNIKNKNMDIRQCWASAAEKVKLNKAPADLGPVDCIDMLQFNKSNLNVPPSVEDAVNQLNLMFNIKLETYLITSIDFKCPFDDHLEMCGVLDKYLIPKNLKKPCYTDIPLLPEIDNLFQNFNDEKSKTNVNTILNKIENEGNEHRCEFTFNENKKEQVEVNFSDSSNEFVGVDELFTENVQNEYDRYLNSPGIDWADTSHVNKDELNVSNHSLLDGIQPLETVQCSSSVRICNNDFLKSQDLLEFETSFNISESMKRDKLVNGENTDTAIKKLHSSPITRLKNNIGTIKHISDTELWNDTSVGLSNLRLKGYMSPLQNKKSNLASSTPLSKHTEKVLISSSKKLELKHDPVLEVAQDEWNLSDLFSSDDSIEEKFTAGETEKNNSTMIGITQMVSFIEKGNEGHDLNQDNMNCVNKSPRKLCDENIRNFNFPSSSVTKINSENNVSIFNKELSNNNKVNDINVLTIDSDIVFADIDDILDSCDNTSEIDEKSVKTGLKSNHSNLSSFTEDKGENNETKIQNSAQNVFPSQSRNFKKFNSNKKRLADKQVGAESLECFWKSEPISQNNIESNKIIDDRGNSLKFKPVVNVIRSSKKLQEASFFDFEFSQSQQICSETSKWGKNDRAQSSIEEESQGESIIRLPASTRVIELDQKCLPQSPKNSILKSSLKSHDDEDDDVFEKPRSLNLKSKALLQNPKIRKKNTEKVNYGYIEKEADVSGTDSSDDEDGTDLDELEESFIDDKSMAVDIHSKYLESIKSPITGKFKLPQNKNYPIDIFSQTVHQDTDYFHDSFCVDSGEESFVAEPSLLEIAEKRLAEKDKNKRKHQNRRKSPDSTSDSGPGSLIMVSSDSNDADGSDKVHVSSKRKIILSSPDSESSNPQIGRNNKLKNNFKRIKVLTISSDESGDEHIKNHEIDKTNNSLRVKSAGSESIKRQFNHKSKLSLRGIKKNDRDRENNENSAVGKYKNNSNQITFSKLNPAFISDDEDEDLLKCIHLSEIEYMKSQKNVSSVSKH